MTTSTHGFAPHAYAVLRILAGLMFLCHGTQKLFGWPIPIPEGVVMPDFVKYVAGGIELVGGALIAVGLFTRWTAFLCAGLMAAAYWMAHGPNHVFPIANGGELAVLYCFLFLVIFTHGPGMWSVDEARSA